MEEQPPPPPPVAEIRINWARREARLRAGLRAIVEELREVAAEARRKADADQRDEVSLHDMESALASSSFAPRRP